VDSLAPGIGEATARVLSRLGLSLDYPDGQTCCGQPAFNAGHFDDARRVARTFLAAFADSEAVVAPSGSCVSMVRNHYERLFADHPSELAAAREVSGKTYELTEFIVGRLGVTDVGAKFSGKAAYHHSCHLSRELGIVKEPLALLSSVEGLELIEMDGADRCCGFGGLFSVKFPEVSAAMARRKADLALASGAEVLVACEPGCLINLRGYIARRGLALRALHVAELMSGIESER